MTGRRSGGKVRSAAAVLAAASERKQVSVLIADLCDSTLRTRGADPERTRAELLSALQQVCDEVEAFGGTVSQLLGDGVLALFGAPVSLEDHAVRACLCAQALHQRAAAASPPCQFRVGIDSGEVVVGATRDFRAAHYRADGDPMASARRLEQAAPNGGTFISAQTLRLLGGQFEVKGSVQLSGHEAKGLGDGFVAFSLGQPAAAALAHRRQLAPLIGRSALFDALMARVATVRGGRLACLGLRGEAGVGKSRIAAALGERLTAQGFASVWISARAYAAHIAGSVGAELARALLGLPAGADLPALRECLALAEDAGPPTPTMLPALAELLDIAVDDAGWRDSTPTQRRGHLVDALTALAAGRLAGGPLLVVIDNLLYIDRESERLLEKLLRRLEGRPLLVVGTYRPEFTPKWQGAPWFSECFVGTLDKAHIEAMAEAIVGDAPASADLRAWLVRRAAGNPLYLEQMALGLIEDGVLVGEPGNYRCTREPTGILPPASLTALIAARADRLGPAAKAALECAAVLGEPIDASRVAAMADRDAQETTALLRQARAVGLLAGDGATLAFRHPLVQEVVAGALASPRRQQLHLAAYRVLEAAAASAPGEDAARLARLAYAGEAWVETVRCTARAVQRAVARSAHRDALNDFALGLDAASRPVADAAALRQEALELRMQALGALLPLGKADEAVQNLEVAHAMAREMGDLRRESGISLQLAVLHWVEGSYARGLECAAVAEATAQRFAGRSAQMAARQARMMLRHGLGRYSETLADARRIQADFLHEIASRPLLPRWAVMSSVNVHAFAADAAAALGHFETAQQACDAAYAELAERDHAFSRVLLDFVQGNVWLAQGRCADAAKLLAQARQRCAQHDVPTMEPPIVARLCVAMARSGEAAAALSLAEQVVEQRLDRIGGRYNAYYFPAAHAATLLACGRHEAALVQARGALAEAQRYSQRGHEAEAHLLAAQAASAGGHQRLASEHFAAAAAIASECGMQALETEAARQVRAALPAASPGPANG